MKKGNIVLIPILLTLIGVGLVVVWKNRSNMAMTVQNNENSNTSDSANIKKIKLLGAAIAISSEYKVEEKISHFSLIKNGKNIEIDKVDSGSFDNLKDYLTDFDLKNKYSKIDSFIDNPLANYSSTVRQETRGGNKKYKIYYILAEGWVYVFSTESEELYNDLDQIAQSFRYTPN